MVLIHSITRSHRLKIDFQESFSETTRSFDIWYVASHSGPLPSLFKYYPWGQKWPCPRGHMFNTGLYWENMKKSSMKPQGLEL